MTRTSGYSGSAAESGRGSMGGSGFPPDARKLPSPPRGSRTVEEENNREGEEDREEKDEEKNEAWETLNRSFREVQTVLDQNRALIQQVNENHQSMIPDNLAKNVALIREINGNVFKVLSLYSNLSADFTGMVQQCKKEQRSVT